MPRVRNGEESFEARLRASGLALTVQRRVVYEELAGRRDHPTPDQIYDAVRDRLPGLSRTTVYRVLDALVQAGLARKLEHAGSTRFDPETARHHHLVCEGCGALADLADELVPPLALPPSGRKAFRVLDYSVRFTGLCSRCQERPVHAEERKTWPGSSRARRPTRT